jgi:hypothetical protein
MELLPIVCHHIAAAINAGPFHRSDYASIANWRKAAGSFPRQKNLRFVGGELGFVVFTWSKFAGMRVAFAEVGIF